MRPVHEFKANFSQAEPAAESQPDSLADALTLHDADSSVRNLCLIWDDGRRAFFNYAYLVAGEFEPNSENNLIRLSFSSHNVALHGYGLERLFMELLDHSPRLILVVDARYTFQNSDNKPVVTAITIDKA